MAKKTFKLLSSPPWKLPPKLEQQPLVSKKDHIVILGCGTSTGSPVLACTCKTCTSNDPRNRRQRASIIMRSEGKTFLIDTSPDLRQQCLSNKIHWIDAVLYTHPHADHMHGADELRTLNFLMGRRIDVYGNEWSLEELMEKFKYIFQKSQEGGGKPHLALHKMGTSPKTIAGVKITPLPIVHGGMDVLGFRIKDIAYITDCSYVPDKTFRSLKNLDVLVLDCLRPNKHPTHLSIEEALSLAKKINAKRTYFTHMGHEIEYNEFAKSLPAGMFPAYDGLIIESSMGEKS